MERWRSTAEEQRGRAIGHVLRPQAPFRLTSQTLAGAFVYSSGDDWEYPYGYQKPVMDLLNPQCAFCW